MPYIIAPCNSVSRVPQSGLSEVYMLYSEPMEFIETEKDGCVEDKLL